MSGLTSFYQVLNMLHTHRATDGTRSQQVSWSHVAAVDCVMGELLLHGPVHVLETETKWQNMSEERQTYRLHTGSPVIQN